MNKIIKNVLDTKKCFKKVTSLLISLCFVLNIANISVLADSKSSYEQQQAIKQMSSDNDSNGNGQLANSVLFMQNLSENLEVDDNGVIYKKEKNEKGNEVKKAIGTWDGKTAKIVDDKGSFVESKSYTEALNIKYNKVETTNEQVNQKENVNEIANAEIKSEGEQINKENYSDIVETILLEDGVSTDTDNKDGKTVVYDKDGLVAGYVDTKNLKAENNKSNDLTVYLKDGTKMCVKEKEINKITYNAQGFTYNEDNKGFLSFSRDVKDVSVMVDKDGTYTSTKITSQHDWWNHNKKTETTITDYDKKGAEVNVKTDSIEGGTSLCGEVNKYANNELLKTTQIGEYTTIEVSECAVTENNNEYGLEEDVYTESTLTFSTDGVEYLCENIIVDEENIEVVKSESKYSRIESEYNGLDYKRSENGNYDVNTKDIEKTVYVNDSKGNEKTKYEYKNGEGYIDNDGNIKASCFTEGSIKDISTGKQVSITKENPSIYISSDYNTVRMEDLTENNPELGNCIALCSSGIDIVFDDETGDNVDNYYMFETQSLGATTFTLVKYDEESGKLVEHKDTTNNTRKDATGEIELSTKDGITKVLTVQKQGDQVNLGVYEANKNNSKETDKKSIGSYSISYQDNGDVQVNSVEVVRDDKGNLTGDLVQENKVTSLYGDKDIKHINATYNESGYDSEKFTSKEQHYTKVSGYEAKQNRKGEVTSLTTIGKEDGSSSLYIKYDDKGRVLQQTYENYSETEYNVTNSSNINLNTLNKCTDSKSINKEVSKYATRGNTTVLNGTTYKAYSRNDLKNIPKEVRNKIGIGTYVHGAQSMTIDAGVTKEVYNSDNKIQSKETIWKADAVYPTKYSLDGEKYVNYSELKGASPKMSVSTVDTLFSEVESVIYDENEKVIDTYTTKTDPYRTKTTNYYNGSSYKTKLTDGEVVTVPSIVSEVTKTGLDGISGFNQTVTRKIDNKEIVTTTKGYKETTELYLDGSSFKTASADMEQVYYNDEENNIKQVITENNIVENTRVDSKGSTYIDRIVQSGKTVDLNTNKLINEVENVHSYTEKNPKGIVKISEKTIGSQKAYSYYGDKTQITYSTNVQSKKEYDDNGLILCSFSDTGVYNVVENIDGQDVILKSGRNILTENYTYSDSSINPTKIDYESEDYDFLDSSAEITKGTKTNLKYNSNNQLTQSTNKYTSNVYGLDENLNVNKNNLKVSKEGIENEYDIKIINNGNGTVTITSKSDKYEKAFDYENNKYIVVTNTNVDSNITTNSITGVIVEKSVSGDLSTWTFENKETLNSVDINKVAEDKEYIGTAGILDAANTYNYKNTNYTYDEYGRETGYQFENIYADGSIATGTVKTDYTLEYQQDSKSINGVQTKVAKTYSNITSTYNFSDGTQKVNKSTNYYNNKEFGNTDIFNSISNFSVSFAEISSVAIDVLSNSTIRNNFIAMPTAKQDVQNKANSTVFAITNKAIAKVEAIVNKILSGKVSEATLAGISKAFDVVEKIVDVSKAAIITVVNTSSSIIDLTIDVIDSTIDSLYNAGKNISAAMQSAFSKDWNGFKENIVSSCKNIIAPYTKVASTINSKIQSNEKLVQFNLGVKNLATSIGSKIYSVANKIVSAIIPKFDNVKATQYVKGTIEKVKNISSNIVNIFKSNNTQSTETKKESLMGKVISKVSSKIESAIDNRITAQYIKAKETVQEIKNISTQLRTNVINILKGDSIKVTETKNGFNINGIELAINELKTLGLDFFAKKVNKDKSISYDASRLQKALTTIQAKYNNKLSLKENSQKVINNIISNVLGISSFAGYFTSYGESDSKIKNNDYSIDQKVELYQIYSQLNSNDEPIKYISTVQSNEEKADIITVVAGMLLSKAELAGNNKVVTILTNTIDRAKNIKESIQKALNVNGVITNYKDPAIGNQITDITKLVIVDYSSFVEEVIKDLEQIFNSKVGEKLTGILAELGIEVSRNAEGKLELVNPYEAKKVLALITKDVTSDIYQALTEEQRAKIDIICEDILSMNTLSIPLSRIGDVICEGADVFSAFSETSTSQTQNKYISKKTLQAYAKQLLVASNLKRNNATNYDDYMSELQKSYAILGNSIIKKDVSDVLNGTKTEADIIFGYEKGLERDIKAEQKYADYFAYMNGTVTDAEFIPQKFKVNVDGNNINVSLEDISRMQTLSVCSQILGTNRTSSPINKMIHGTQNIEEIIEETNNEVVNNKSDYNTNKVQSQSIYTSQQIDDMVKQITDHIYVKYEQELDFTKKQVSEHVRNAISAYSQIERKDYKIVNSLGQDYNASKDGADGKICAIHNSVDSPNIVMPAGQVQALEAINGLPISKPTDNSYISNSVEALSLFNNVVVADTPTQVQNNAVLDKMDVQIENIPSNLDAYTTIVQTEQQRAQYIYKMTNKFQEQGNAVFNLTLTSDSAQSYDTYQSILSQTLGNKQISDVQVITLLETMKEISKDKDVIKKVEQINNSNKETEKIKLANEIIESKAKIIQQNLKEYNLELTEKQAKSIATIKYVDSTSTQINNGGLSDVDILKEETKAGLYDYIISDAELLKSFDVGNMKKAQAIINARQGKTGTVIANNFLLDSSMMTQSQLVQGANKIDPYGDSKFDSKCYDKNVIQLHSVENLSKNKTLSEIVGENGKWTVDVINKNLKKVQIENAK